MTFLTPDHTRVETIGTERLTIKSKIIPDSARAAKYVAPHVTCGQPMKPCAPLSGDGAPRGITIHNTGMIQVADGTNAAEQYMRATWPNCNMGGVVVHFYVWRDEIWQQLDERERGWHAADGESRRSSRRTGCTIGGNLDTIAIECIGEDAQSEATAAKLTAYLLSAHNLIPETDVYTHQYFYPLKNCPAYILPHWDSFMAQVTRVCNAARAKVLHRVQCDAFRDWGNAIARYYEIAAAGYTPYMILADGLYKVQVGAFSELSNAEALAADLASKGFRTYLTDTAGVPVAIPA